MQNGRIVGAVTHVLVNDPTRGYGIFIENMLKAVLIEDGLGQKERLMKLNKIAIHQMSILEEQNLKIIK